MKKLNYFEFEFKFNEDEGFLGGKLFSKYTADFENPSNIGNIFANPPQSNGYSADKKIPNEEIIFYDFLVDENALRLDDFMETSDVNRSFGFFVSPRLKDIISEYDLSDHRYYPVNLKFENKLHPYYFLLISSENNGVNYPKSKFVDWYDEDKVIPINKYEDLLKENINSENNRKFWSVKEVEENIIVFDKKLDIYQALTITNSSFYFSERLKERLEKEGITGMWLHPTDTPEFYLKDE